MDKWIAALTAIGGLAGIGGLVDLAMYKSEKVKLKALLEDWWLRFVDVKWSNFGRAEAELAVQILDRRAGARLWSWKRWRFSIVVTLVVFAFAMTWTVVRVTIGNGVLYNPFVIGSGVVSDPGAIDLAYLLLPPSLVALALSLSATRFIAVRAARLCKGRLASVMVFAALLGLHVLLFLYWSALVFALEVLLIRLVYAAVAGTLAIDPNSVGFREIVFELVDADTVPQSLGAPWPRSWRYLFSLDSVGQPLDQIRFSFKTAMDIVANGLRIVFALVFLSSFVFRPLLQEPVSRLWYGVINSDKPTFTMLFGAVGATVAAVELLSK
jgi:hypothetical protein